MPPNEQTIRQLAKALERDCEQLSLKYDITRDQVLQMILKQVDTGQQNLEV